MNSNSNAEQIGRTILGLFRQLHIRPSESVGCGRLYPMFLNAGGHPGHFDLGLKWLEDSGFIDSKDPTMGPYMLTDKGRIESERPQRVEAA